MTTSTTNLVASNHRACECDFQAHFAVERHEWSETRVDWHYTTLHYMASRWVSAEWRAGRTGATRPSTGITWPDSNTLTLLWCHSHTVMVSLSHSHTNMDSLSHSHTNMESLSHSHTIMESSSHFQSHMLSLYHSRNGRSCVTQPNPGIGSDLGSICQIFLHIWMYYSVIKRSSLV